MVNKLFRPFNFKKRGKCFHDVALTLAVSALLATAIVLGVALWAIYHPPKFHQANYASYYSASEYRRLMKDMPPLNNRFNKEARPVDAEP